MVKSIDLKYNMDSAPERYARMGFPEKYRVTITYRQNPSLFYGADIHLHEWVPVFSKWRKRYLRHEWRLIKSKMVSASQYWDDEDADKIARAWLFEIRRHEVLAQVPPPIEPEIEEETNE